MSEILLLIRVHIDEIDNPGVESYYLTARERFAKMTGILGSSLWRDHKDSGQSLIAFEFRDVESADRAMAAISTVHLLSESQAAEFEPAEAIRVIVRGRFGRRVSEAATTGFLSMSLRISDPGYGDDLVSEIDQIFQHLRLIPGFAGAIFGTSDDLDEEVIGVVTWDSKEAFVASLPPSQRPYEVKLFARVG